MRVLDIYLFLCMFVYIKPRATIHLYVEVNFDVYAHTVVMAEWII